MDPGRIRVSFSSCSVNANWGEPGLVFNSRVCRIIKIKDNRRHKIITFLKAAKVVDESNSNILRIMMKKWTRINLG